jgi:hypothetical protein
VPDARGLDPAIHPFRENDLVAKEMDPRVKPAGDAAVWGEPVQLSPASLPGLTPQVASTRLVAIYEFGTRASPRSDAIHPFRKKDLVAKEMDPRVKPAGDAVVWGEASAMQ